MPSKTDQELEPFYGFHWLHWSGDLHIKVSRVLWQYTLWLLIKSGWKSTPSISFKAFYLKHGIATIASKHFQIHFKVWSAKLTTILLITIPRKTRKLVTFKIVSFFTWSIPCASTASNYSSCRKLNFSDLSFSFAHSTLGWSFKTSCLSLPCNFWLVLYFVSQLHSHTSSKWAIG